MAKYRLGRVALHLICIVRGSDCRMHLAGVMREFVHSAVDRRSGRTDPRHLVPRDFDSVAGFEGVQTERRPNTDGSLTT